MDEKSHLKFIFHGRMRFDRCSICHEHWDFDFDWAFLTYAQNCVTAHFHGPESGLWGSWYSMVKSRNLVIKKSWLVWGFVFSTPKLEPHNHIRVVASIFAHATMSTIYTWTTTLLFQFSTTFYSLQPYNCGLGLYYTYTNKKFEWDCCNTFLITINIVILYIGNYLV